MIHYAICRSSLTSATMSLRSWSTGKPVLNKKTEDDNRKCQIILGVSASIEEGRVKWASSFSYSVKLTLLYLAFSQSARVYLLTFSLVVLHELRMASLEMHSVP